MQVEFLIQKGKENSMLDNMISSFEKNPKKVYMFLGDLKEAGFKLIEEEFIDTKIKLFMAIGINKKHTTRNMLESILEYTKDAYYYSNNDIVEYNSNLCIFETTNEAIIYSSASPFSESGISENVSFYTKTIFDLKDTKEKQEYKKAIKDLTKTFESLNFTKLDKEAIEKLVENKEIFTTRQYTHSNVMSISELLGKTEEQKQEEKKVAKNEENDIIGSSIEIPKVDLSGIDIDIDDIDLSTQEDIAEIDNSKKVEEEVVEDNSFDVEYDEEEPKNINIQDYIESEEVEDVIDKDNELYDESLADMKFDENSVLDINDMLFSKSEVKLDENVKTRKKKEKKVDPEFAEEELVQVKKVNLNNISNLIMELPTRNSKGQDLTSIKVPNYIQKMIPDFFGLQDNGTSVEIDGVSYRQKDISLEIIDVKTNSKFSDRKAKLSQRKGQSYLIFSSDIIKNISYDEKDIARVIKLSEDTYHIEIIAKDMQEYRLWDKLCNQTFKASTRKYGMM